MENARLKTSNEMKTSKVGSVANDVAGVKYYGGTKIHANMLNKSDERISVVKPATVKNKKKRKPSKSKLNDEKPGEAQESMKQDLGKPKNPSKKNETNVKTV